MIHVRGIQPSERSRTISLEAQQNDLEGDSEEWEASTEEELMDDDEN